MESQNISAGGSGSNNSSNNNSNNSNNNSMVTRDFLYFVTQIFDSIGIQGEQRKQLLDELTKYNQNEQYLFLNSLLSIALCFVLIAHIKFITFVKV